MRPLNQQTLSGKSWQGLTLLGGQLVHAGILADWQKLVTDAAEAGFCLGIASGFRDYQRQKLIWNNKFNGQREVYNDSSEVVNIHELEDEAKVRAIMRFSAIPGASRHHWGTELDVYDLNAMPQGYQLKLSPDEYTGQGIFSALDQWLEHKIENGQSHGFFRPYSPKRQTCCGIANEPWHLSYVPLSSMFQQALTVSLWREMLEQQDFAGKNIIIEKLESLHRDYLDIPVDLYPHTVSVRSGSSC